MNKALLLQLQQEKAKANRELELRHNMRQIYDNLGYESNELKLDSDSNSTKAPTDTCIPAQMMENQQEEGEERIDRFWAPTKEPFF